MWIEEEKAKTKRCPRDGYACSTEECMGWLGHPNKSRVGTCPSLREIADRPMVIMNRGALGDNAGSPGDGGVEKHEFRQAHDDDPEMKEGGGGNPGMRTGPPD